MQPHIRPRVHATPEWTIFQWWRFWKSSSFGGTVTLRDLQSRCNFKWRSLPLDQRRDFGACGRMAQQPEWEQLCCTGSLQVRKECWSTAHCSQAKCFQLLEAGTERCPERNRVPDHIGQGRQGQRWLESIQRILWINIESGKNISQYTDESIFLPTSSELDLCKLTVLRCTHSSTYLMLSLYKTQERVVTKDKKKRRRSLNPALDF